MEGAEIWFVYFTRVFSSSRNNVYFYKELCKTRDVFAYVDVVDNDKPVELRQLNSSFWESDVNVHQRHDVENVSR